MPDREARRQGPAEPQPSPSPPDRDLDVARLARERLEAGDGEGAWLLAERLARRRKGLIADDAILKALAMGAMRCPDLAWADIRDAAAIDPTHPAANRLLLRSPDPAEREEAARRLIGRDPAAAAQSGALAVLGRCGLDAVGWLQRDGAVLRGWAVWTGDERLSCRLRWADGDISDEIRARQGARIPAAFDRYADIALPWPTSAEWVAVECALPRAAFMPDRFWRSTEPPRIAPGAAGPRERRSVAVIVPVYDDIEATRACLDSLLAEPDHGIVRRIIVIDDATPDPRIAAVLDELARKGRIECLRNAHNLGFAASVNRGLAALRPGEDALLLNADTVAPPRLCSRLAEIAYRRKRIGTVTPLSNNGEYTSFPSRFRENPLPSRDALLAWDRLAAEQDPAEIVDLPNGIGFCLYIKRALLDAVGGLSLRFGRGYGEDIEFCLRAREAGFSHVCATNVVVGHAGTRSFKAGKRALVVANLAEIDRLHPDYRRASAAFVREDPLRAVVSRLEWSALQDQSEVLACLIAPAGGADVADRYARDQAALGLATLVASVAQVSDRLHLHLRRVGGGAPQNVSLTYEADNAAGALARDLKRISVARLAFLDPATLPRALATMASHFAVADVILADAAAILSPGARKTGKSWTSLLTRADRILPTSDRLAAALGQTWPDLAAKLGVLPASRAAALVMPEHITGRSILVYCDEDDLDASQLLAAFASRLRKSDPAARLIIDGAHRRETDLVALGNIVVLGVNGADEFGLLRRMSFAMVLFLSARWSLGDARLETVTRLGLPAAYLDPTLQRSVAEQDVFGLAPREKPALAAQALIRWHDAVRGRVGEPAIARSTRSAPGPAAMAV